MALYEPRNFLNAADVNYFTARTDWGGEELWRTESDGSGIRIVADIWPGQTSSFLQPLAELHGELLFLATDSEHGRELWLSDGTTDGTHLLTELSVGATGVSFLSGAAWRDSYVFSAYDESTHRNSLYRTDGTASGTGFLFDPATMPAALEGSTDVRVLQAAGDKLFFEVSANGTAHVVATDGTTAGTVSLGEVSRVLAQEVYHGKLGLVVGTTSGGSALWVSDGSAAGTTEIVALGDRAPITAQIAVTSQGLLIEDRADQSLWKTDLTPQGTRQISSLWNNSIYAFGDRIFYFESGGNGTLNLFRTDPSFADVQSALIPAGFRPNWYRSYQSAHAALFDFRESRYFILNADGLHTRQLSDDGRIVAVGTAQQEFFIFTYAYAKIESRLLISDGTVAGTIQSNALKSENEGTYSPERVSGGTGLFFQSGSSQAQPFSGRPWFSDGTASGTKPVLFLSAEQPVTGAENPVAVGQRIFFSAQVFGQGYRLFSFDPILREAKAIPRLVGLHAFDVVSLGDRAFVRTESSPTDLSNPYEDGQLLQVNEDGSVEIIAGGAYGEYGGYIQKLVSMNGWLYFLSTESLITSSALSLWRSDGTAAGTQQIRVLTSTSWDPYSLRLAAGDNRLYMLFREVTGNSTIVWKSDGTAEGTSQVGGALANGGIVSPNPNFSQFSRIFFVAADRLYFPGYQSNSGWQIYSTDGTAAGTQLVSASSSIGTSTSLIEHAVVARGKLFYLRDSKLYVTSGTTDSTRQISGPGIKGIGSAFNHVYVNQTGQDGRSSLWKSDGGILEQILDSMGQPAPSGPGSDWPALNFAEAIDGNLLFLAEGGAIGVEPFKVSTLEPLEFPGTTTVHRAPGGRLFGFSWERIQGATDYEIQFADGTNGTFSASMSTGGRSSWTLPADFAGSVITINVRAVSATGDVSPFNGQRSFVIDQLPSLIFPPDVTADGNSLIHVLAPETSVATTLWIGDITSNRRVALLECQQYPATIGNWSAALPPLTPGLYGVWAQSRLADGTITSWTLRHSMRIVLPGPGILSLTASEETSTISLEWELVPGATTYEIQILSDDARNIVSNRIIQNPYASSVRLLLPGDNYTLSVRALKGTTPVSDWSQQRSILLTQKPIVSANRDGISWKPVSAVVVYIVRVRNSQTGAQVLYQTLHPRENSLYFSNLLPPGKYTATVAVTYRGANESVSTPVSLEFFRAAIQPTTQFTSTIDATPVIQWNPAPGAKTYELAVSSGTGTSVTYRGDQIAATSHRIAKALSPGQYTVWVRAAFADGTRSLWGQGLSIRIGGPVTLSFSQNTLLWPQPNSATHYEVWITYYGTGSVPITRVVHETYFTDTWYTLPAGLAKGRYTAWVRALRSESSEVYTGLWSLPTVFSI